MWAFEVRTKGRDLRDADWSAPNSNGPSGRDFVKIHLRAFIIQLAQRKAQKEMTDLTIGEIYIFFLWFITVEFLKLVWLVYILFLIWLIIHYLNNYCIEINFV